ncbi:1,2-dihydroxy-3-keto-5-methylthiopentene dioxygenase [Toxocara canis]|uniref:Acireductone dioxygenase n=1 Tax=Toxocara canis TaxID=6265 RepID=A0A0B2UZU1_TOXCA|nr:1,2-dihydroxy-3-keto-5-methylthiopentene dioxygenase [Toxocara canis]
MVQAWLMCSPVVNKSAPCACDPPVDISTAEIDKIGILTKYIPVVEKEELIEKVCEERGYKFRDELVISKEKLSNYEEEIPVVEKEELIEKVCEERGYKFRDELVISKEKLSNYEEEIKKFFEEHMHTDEEARYVLDGSGYFDVRNHNDEWIRIAVQPGDAVILPPGIFHRFTPDHRDYVHFLRLFKDNQQWVAHNRNELAKVMSIRQQYLKDYIENIEK